VAGKLYLVGTPIGNLGDITLRALETLRSVKHVAAEDTRHTRGLLTHFEIHGKALHALDANAGARKLAELIRLLESGEDLAFVTDAGMPSVSDPGTELVREARAHGIDVSPIPGPSALTSAVAVSGLVAASFCFLGFLPRHGKKRREVLTRILRSPEPIVLFESPQRMAATLRELASTMPERRATLCREISKIHEEIAAASLSELAAREAPWRGEITLVIAAADPQDEDPVAMREALSERIALRLAEGASVKTVVGELDGETELPRRDLYSLVQKAHEAARGS
jgi:16S rRNA (cytidine1402-2'-O)-methyltransferase